MKRPMQTLWCPTCGLQRTILTLKYPPGLWLHCAKCDHSEQVKKPRMGDAN